MDINQAIDSISQKMIFFGGHSTWLMFSVWFLKFCRKNIPPLLDWWQNYQSKYIDLEKKKIEFEEFKNNMNESDKDTK